MTISIKPTASGSTIEQDGSTILTVDGSGNITPSNSMYPKVPAFRAKISTVTSLSNNTWTKVTFDNEEYDTTNDFSSSRFTPSVAGYYMFSASLGGLASLGTNAPIAIFKNGGWNGGSNSTVNGYGNSTNQYYANGTTDYFEVYQFQNTGSSVNNNTGSANMFAGHLVSV